MAGRQVGGDTLLDDLLANLAVARDGSCRGCSTGEQHQKGRDYRRLLRPSTVERGLITSL